MQQVVWQNLLI